MRNLAARIAVLALFGLLLSTGNLLAADYWKWSPKADHHFGVVKVSVQGARGSGALIHVDEAGTGYILTAAHVVGESEKATAEWTNGYRSMGRVTHVSRQGTHDIALFIVKPPEGYVTIPVAATPPEKGEKLEVCGYGGPDLGIRHFFVTNRYQSVQGWSVCEGTVLPGDSGGPILSTGKSPTVVGMACNGQHMGRQVFDGEVTDVVQPIQGPGTQWINDFLEVACPGGCNSGILPRPFGGSGMGDGSRPRTGGGGSSRPPADSGPQEEEYVPPKKGSTTGPTANAETESLKKKLAELEALLAEKNKTPPPPAFDPKCLDEKFGELRTENQKVIDAILADSGELKNRIAKVESVIVKIDAKVSTGNQGPTAEQLSDMIDSAVSKIPGCDCDRRPPPVVNPPAPPAPGSKGDPNNSLIIYITVKDGRFAKVDKEVDRRKEDGYNIRIVELMPTEIGNMGTLPRLSKFPESYHYRGESEVIRYLAGLVK
jgi:hypothetical protein